MISTWRYCAKTHIFTLADYLYVRNDEYTGWLLSVWVHNTLAGAGLNLTWLSWSQPHNLTAQKECMAQHKTSTLVSAQSIQFNSVHFLHTISVDVNHHTLIQHSSTLYCRERKGELERAGERAMHTEISFPRWLFAWDRHSNYRCKACHRLHTWQKSIPSIRKQLFEDRPRLTNHSTKQLSRERKRIWHSSCFIIL